MSYRTICVIGSLNTDLVTITDRIPNGGETLTSSSFTTHAGGKGANAAVAAHRISHKNPKASKSVKHDSFSVGSLAIEVFMVGAVGDDEFGAPLIRKIQDNGVDVSSVETVKGQSTGVAVIIVESQSGENRILYNPGANNSLRPGNFTKFEMFTGGDLPDLLILQLEIPLDTVEYVIVNAYEDEIDVLLNPSPAHRLHPSIYERCTHLILNQAEAMMLSEPYIDNPRHRTDWPRVANEFLRMGVKNVVITLGAEGACYSDAKGNKGMIHAETGVEVVDTTGAG